MRPPNPLRALAESVNAEDTEGFLDSFADDALVDDDGHRYQGLLQIAEWNTRQVIGVHVRVRALTDDPAGAEGAVAVELVVDGREHRRRVDATWHEHRIQHLRVRSADSA